jgi:hypothetical protein
MRASIDIFAMTARKANSVKETREMLLEMDEKLKRAEDCGKTINLEEVKTVMVMWMDDETKRCLVKDLRKEYRELRRAVNEHVEAMVTEAHVHSLLSSAPCTPSSNP